MDYFEIEKLKKILDFKEDSPSANTLLKDNNKLALLIALKKHQKLPEHVSETDAFIYIIEGKVEFKLKDDRIYTLDEGEIMKFKPFEEHCVVALKDSIFLVVRI